MISKRLKYIVDKIGYHTVVADIGTDHGYVSVELIKNNKASNVISSDISAQSLKKAQDYILLNGLEDKISTRVGDGIKVLEKDEVDAVIIAGMGGVLISSIIDESYFEKFAKKTPLLVLQPVQQQKDMRIYLYENKFEIIDEDILEDMGKIYHIILAKKSNATDKNYENIKKFDTDKKDVYLEYGIININRKLSILKDVMSKRIKKDKTLANELKSKSIDSEHINNILGKTKCVEEIYETL